MLRLEMKISMCPQGTIEYLLDTLCVAQYIFSSLLKMYAIHVIFMALTFEFILRSTRLKKRKITDHIFQRNFHC